MREGWESVEIGDVISRRNDYTPVQPDSEYAIVGVQRSGLGLVDRKPIRGADMKFNKLLTLAQDDLVYRTITAFEAPMAVVGQEHEGRLVTPSAFPVFTIERARLLPDYMRLLATWPGFHREMLTRCTGSVVRRKTLSVDAFRSIPVGLPPRASAKSELRRGGGVTRR